jgi:two-component system LytT family sensor kinase
MFLKKKYFLILAHILFWALFVFFFNQLFDIRIRWRLEQGQKIDPANPDVLIFQFSIIKSLLVGLAFKIILFYTNYYFLLKRYSQRKKVFNYLIKLILLVAACYTAELITKNTVNSDIKSLHLDVVNDFIEYYARINIVFYILILGFSFIYFFTNEWAKNERIKNHLRAEQLAAELKLLKLQINPHFFFNTLNNLYGLAQEHNNTELASGINTLADIMRYIVYESNEKLVPLQKEINYINDYLKIFKLRIAETDDVSVSFKIEGDISDKFIAPLLLIPFVENACKHGVNFKQRSYINILVSVKKDVLSFSVCNSDHKNYKNGYDTASGVGLENVHKRLELLYPDKYKLQIKSATSNYEMQLILPV